MSYTVILHTELGPPPSKKTRLEDDQSANRAPFSAAGPSHQSESEFNELTLHIIYMVGIMILYHNIPLQINSLRIGSTVTTIR